MPDPSNYLHDPVRGPLYRPTRPARPNRKKRTVTMPERVGPHVKLVFAEMARLRFTYDEVEEGSGVRRASMKAWRKKNRPGLESLEAVLGFLGWDFIAVPRAKALPEEVVAELKPIADKLSLTMPQTVAALIEIVTGIHDRFPAHPRAEIVEGGVAQAAEQPALRNMH
ncbi:hypothetical protein BJ122_11150 [Rhodopseudomonas faecalis]|uniref:Uncharacterized protein n=1 Tax=Rhodopseudomonas faecalis TaxID=99655 RepID=A0A318TC82_9BRAD|nr:hypothetical protein [Rhodopseudomonas faecalis]PYF02551.1 hypothetical protein BJ122_11150 [Rhodopseudomonas faecalis]